MNYSILSENQKKRIHQPIWLLICFAMFNFWQMGFIYYIGPSLTINGKTPLPIDMNNATTLIAICYILSIVWMIFLPRTVVHTQRIATCLALVSAAGLFMPLSNDILRFLIYIQIFCCCLIIGFETFIMVNYFCEQTNIKHLTVAYGVALFMIAVLQNEFIPITFPFFRIIMVISLSFLLLFFFKMPTEKAIQPQYIKKSDNLTPPKKLLIGTYILVFVGSFMGVSGPAISGEIKHGIFITYLTDALISILLYFLHKKLNFHPFRIITYLVALGCVGFLLMLAVAQIPQLSYIACALIGFGMVSCQMLPLYGAVIMKTYPSRYISSIIISLALVAVLVQGSLVEIFRKDVAMLYLVYTIIMVILVLIYMQIEPFFLFVLRKRIVENENDVKESYTASERAFDPLNVLTKKEKEVVDLICLGYTNKDIAKLLFISEHTVKDHTKNIYPKMNVHSRLELATVINKYRANEKKLT